jgi:hypothetical protein
MEFFRIRLHDRYGERPDKEKRPSVYQVDVEAFTFDVLTTSDLSALEGVQDIMCYEAHRTTGFQGSRLATRV